MATGFSTDEVQAATDKFLLTLVQVPATRLGLRDVLASRDAVYSLLSTTLLLRPDSFFYIVWLATNKLEAMRRQQVADVELILRDLPDTGRQAKPVGSTTELSNAQAALAEVSGGLNARTTGVRGPLGPAVDRFQQSVENFVTTELVKNVVDASKNVVSTASQLRAEIGTTWQGVKTRHADMRVLAQAITTAVDQLGAVHLPQKAVQDIVTKMRTRLDELITVMNDQTQAVTQSRQAMLDLLVMRTLMAKSSSFRTPLLELMPLVGDPSTGDLVAGTSPGTLVSAKSGPFGYPTASVLNLQTGTPVTPAVVNLPGAANAVIRSRPDLPASVTFAGTEELHISINGAAPLSYAPGAGAQLLAVLAANITGAGIPCAVSGSQLVITSASFGDDSSLEIFQDTPGRLAFVAIVGFSVFAQATPIPTRDVVAATGATTGAVSASSVRTNFGTFNGLILSGAGNQNKIYSQLAAGTDLVLNSTDTTVTSSTTNFQNLGVRAGQALVLPIYALSFVIQSVSNNTLVLDAAPGVTDPGTTFRIGPSLAAVTVGSRVVVRAADKHNSGYYRVLSIPDPTQLMLDRDFTVRPDTASFDVFSDFLKLSAVGTSPTDGIAVFPASAADAALGFTASATQQLGLANTLNVTGDLLNRGVRDGDLLLLDTDTLLSPRVILTIPSTTTLTFEPGLDFDAGSPPGTVTYEIVSARFQAYDVLCSGQGSARGVLAWLSQWVDLSELDRRVNQVLVGGQFKQAQSLFQSYLDSTVTPVFSGDPQNVPDLTTLGTDLHDYVVPFEQGIDNIVKTLNEQGMDRALDLLIQLRILEFFTMPAEGVSYATYLTRQTAEAAKLAAPVSKFSKSDAVVEETRPFAFQPDPFNPDNGDPPQRR